MLEETWLKGMGKGLEMLWRVGSLIISVIHGRVVAGDNTSREILRNRICPSLVGWCFFCLFCLIINYLRPSFRIDCIRIKARAWFRRLVDVLEKNNFFKASAVY